MREPVRDKGRLEHILAAIGRVLDFTSGKTKNEVTANALVYYGIVKNIEIIGEAAYKLSKPFKQAHPETPWEYIVKMRHVLVHDYYQIDEDDVWAVIEDDLPLLREQIARYLSETDWSQWEKQPLEL